jgi:hypothetical protein
MLYYGLTKKTPQCGIRADDGVQYGGVAHSQTKVTGVRIKKCKVRAWMSVLGVKSKGSWHGLDKTSWSMNKRCKL